MREKVFQIVSQVMMVPVEQINEQSAAQNIEAWDSLNHMNLILALEEEFGARFSDEQIMRMLDIKTIIAEVTEMASYAGNAG